MKPTLCSRCKKNLAVIFITKIDGGKTVKAMDGGVYLMKQIRCPGVLVECGFLSNDKEAAHLQTEEHQRRLAAAILAGLLQYSTKEG